MMLSSCGYGITDRDLRPADPQVGAAEISRRAGTRPRRLRTSGRMGCRKYPQPGCDRRPRCWSGTPLGSARSTAGIGRSARTRLSPRTRRRCPRGPAVTDSRAARSSTREGRCRAQAARRGQGALEALRREPRVRPGRRRQRRDHRQDEGLRRPRVPAGRRQGAGQQDHGAPGDQPTRRVRGLGAKQRAALVAEFSASNSA